VLGSGAGMLERLRLEEFVEVSLMSVAMGTPERNSTAVNSQAAGN
jgi:hypothetical protein